MSSMRINSLTVLGYDLTAAQRGVSHMRRVRIIIVPRNLMLMPTPSPDVTVEIH